MAHKKTVSGRNGFFIAGLNECENKKSNFLFSI